MSARSVHFCTAKALGALSQTSVGPIVLTSATFIHKPLHYLACVAKETDRLRKAKIITSREQAGILVCSLLTLGHRAPVAL